MSGIRTISQTNTRQLLNAHSTGKMALGGMCLTCASAMIKTPKVWKMHKPLAFVTSALTFLHLGVAIHEHHKKSKQKNTIS